jgi:ribosomal protein L30/L7E
MQAACEIINISETAFKTAKHEIIYFGDGFCQNKIPTARDILKALRLAKKYDKKLVFVTPYVTSEGLKKLEKVFNTLSKNNYAGEIVFNDWGVFNSLKKYPKLKHLVLGRLLAKQKTDPAIYELISRRRSPDKAKQKKIPLTMKHYFASASVDDIEFQKFLKARSVTRVETDYIFWDKSHSKKSLIKKSLYLPYTYVTTTRLCGIISMRGAKCDKSCKIKTVQYSGDNGADYVAKGNTLFFYNKKLPSLKNIKQSGIDRIVFNEIS